MPAKNKKHPAGKFSSDPARPSLRPVEFTPQAVAKAAARRPKLAPPSATGAANHDRHHVSRHSQA